MTSIRYHAKVTLEFTTPFHIGSGKEDLSDAVVVRDANGLPTIPGSSLAGVLRSLYPNREEVDSIFGFQKPRKESRTDQAEGEGSRLVISWAHIHDQTNRPVDGLKESGLKERPDPVLANARRSTIRDHVRLNENGVADGRGKFDEEVIAAGHRFSFRMELLGTENPDQDEIRWKNLLETLQSPLFRLGAKTRRGLGAIRIHRILQARFDLSSPEGLTDYLELPVPLDSDAYLEERSVASSGSPGGSKIYRMQIQPRGFWFFGGGVDPDGERDADLAPVREWRIVWNENQGEEQEVLVLPASSIKGAVAHRTLYHLRCRQLLAGQEINPGDISRQHKQLFGYEGDPDTGPTTMPRQRGRVILDDVMIPIASDSPRPQLVHHVAIDGFTGGARDRMLFNELPLYGGSPITLNWHLVEINRLEENLIQSFEDTLTDLCEGRLALGSGAGRGNGFWEGTWSRSMEEPV